MLILETNYLRSMSVISKCLIRCYSGQESLESIFNILILKRSQQRPIKNYNLSEQVYSVDLLSILLLPSLVTWIQLRLVSTKTIHDLRFRLLLINITKTKEFGKLFIKKKNTSHSTRDLSSFQKIKRSWGALERCR